MNYNLLDEKWIPILRMDGSVTRVGITEALTQAGHVFPTHVGVNRESA